MVALQRDRQANELYSWTPQPGPQTAFVRCPLFEVFFGGARGGGKTDAALGEFLSHADEYGSAAIGLMVRRTLKQLRETVARSKQIYGPMGAKFNEQDKEWVFPNGARFVFAYLERDDDANHYQGHSYTRVYIEEIGNFPSPAPIMKLMATLRSGSGVPCGFRATGNPGGPGHQWVKARYIDPAPGGWKKIEERFTNPFDQSTITRERIFIPSHLSDNKYLGTDYVANLQMSGSPELVRAWLEGDWNVVTGAFFPEFGARQIIPARELPPEWPRFRSGDWGSARPFSFGWWAISDGSLPSLPRGALVRYREWYGWNGNPNEGCRLTAEEVGLGLAVRDGTDNVSNGGSVLDPAAFSQDGGPSIAERISNGSRDATGRPRVIFRRADNKRVANRGAIGGWDQVRARLKGDPDGLPMVFFMDNCIHAIRTLPALQHDEMHPEDVDCWVAGTLVSTPSGDVPIEQVVPGDVVDTPIGPCPVLRSYLSGTSETVWIELTDGRRLEGTPRHKVYVEGKGLTPLSDVQCHDTLIEKNTWLRQRSLSIAVSSTAAIQAASTTIRTALSSPMEVLAFIARSGSMLATRFRRVGTSITRMATTITTPLRTSPAFLGQNIAAPTYWSVSPVSWEKNSRHGVVLTREWLSSERMPERCLKTRPSDNVRALIVDWLLRLNTLSNVIARSPVPRKPIIRSIWSALFAKSHSEPSVTQPSKFKPARIIAVGHSVDRKPVYNLTIDKAHLFYANGILSSNTEGEDHAPDEIRYAAMSRPYIPSNQPRKPDNFAGIPIGGIDPVAPAGAGWKTTLPTMDQLWKDHARWRTQ